MDIARATQSQAGSNSGRSIFARVMYQQNRERKGPTTAPGGTWMAPAFI
jgi:hypothetical protein